ncbi:MULTISPECIES: type VII secretion-associated protein [unclassified Rhodococcus (in: high G+C Gram-positive bacteria)]|uniref:type VII secretion-associated protein n=1 Tax=unclassified Rhodococcus (in: high G+C Gram-positive bacteria) TaxID=192944 RepID=UPI00233ECFD9|nr:MULTISPECIES: type VII secretion-associated protein [unclassified Rhodococcus (in: high G+C Gram-positive bacteria)]WSE21390.1 type VII secretion-associated protein [Rhodococcus sp. PD04]
MAVRDETVAAVAFTLTPGSVHIGWPGTTRSVPALAADLGDRRVYGAAAGEEADPVGLGTVVDVTELVDAAAVGTETELGELLSGLVSYAAATVGAPDTGGLACAIHPTWWNERRRDLFRTAVRQVAGDTILLPVAVVATRAADPAPHERCAVLEFAAGGVTAVSIGPPGPDGPTVERLARDPGLSVHCPDAATRLENLLTSVCGGAGPEVVVVTGAPGEPSGVESFALVADLVGAGRRIVPVAASEMLVAVTGPPTPPAGIGPTSRAPAVASTTDGPDRTLPWLSEVRARPDPPRAGRAGAVRTLVVAGAVIPSLLAAAIFLWPRLAGEGGDAEAPDPPEVVAAAEVPADAREHESAADAGPSPSTRIDAGPLHLDLPEDWRVRDAATVPEGRAELVPVGGTDRRILVVYRDLPGGTDEHSVAAALAERAAERAPVIRDLDTDTTFADRKVVAYTEVPDDYSVVRWSVLVFPSSATPTGRGLQVSVGCQYLEEEWTRIRSECEQAVHTLRVG